MSTNKGKNLQAPFLTTMHQQKIPLAIYLMSGIKLQGVVTSFDESVILLEHDHVAQMIYKHAISTIVPSKMVTLVGEGE
jgi:host factor-I protein